MPLRPYRSLYPYFSHSFCVYSVISVDVWSGGCVMAELLMNRPIFRGTKSSDQMEKIMRVLGAPTRPQVKAMNPDFRRELTTPTQRSLEEVRSCRIL